MNLFVTLGAINAFIAVAAGPFGAHGPEDAARSIRSSARLVDTRHSAQHQP